MTPNDLLEHVLNVPFKPFNIYLSDGRSFAVTHPDQLIVSESAAMLGIGRIGRQRVKGFDRIALNQITSIREVPELTEKERMDAAED